MLPTFIIIGAMKCGTSSLYHYLAAHPDIAMSRVKETNFFRSETDFARGVDWYESLFGPGAARGEASPGYSQAHAFPGVPERMVSVVPDVQLVYLVRDPVERIVSHWMHNRAAGRERRSIDDALEGESSHYVLTSMYGLQLEAFREHYSDDRIMVVAAEDLRKERTETVQSVCRFLGLDDGFESPVFERDFNRSEGKRESPDVARRLPGRALKRLLRRVGGGSPVERPRLEGETKRRIIRLLEADVAELRRSTGQGFPDWCL